MPEIHTTTPRETYTIAGESFSIPQPYKHGHSLTEGEASQLNQVYAENVRNNLAGKVKEQKETGAFDQEVFQGTVDDYCEGYEFGVRTGGGRTGDPVRAEAMNIAREAVRKAIRDKGHKLADVSSATITKLASNYLEKTPSILAIARARVEQVAAIAEVELEGLEIEEKPEAEAAAAPRGKKAAA